MSIIKKKGKSYGLIPKSYTIDGNDAIITFRVPKPPLVIYTISVKYADHYGFSVIDENGNNILSKVSIEGNNIRLKCNKSPINCKLRYAVNGDYMKSGPEHGPRGNLRDSQGETEKISILKKIYPVHNWAYQFDMPCN